MIKRKLYQEFLYRHKDKKIIKVLSGVRRSGKTTILQIFKESLLDDAVLEEQIHSINFEDLKYYELRDFQKLNEYLMESLIDGKKNYIFLDEIQHVNKFEIVVDSLFVQENVDVYITGSNAYFMSGELATNLTGRYVEKEVLPFSFKEYYLANENKDLNREELFDDYLFSALPYLSNTNDNQEKTEYLQGIYDSILAKDIVLRTGASDVSFIERILRTICSSLGSIVSINKLSNTLNSVGFKISNQTLEKYIDGMVDSKILYSVPRFDIKSKELLQRLEKYYLVDLGFKNLLLPDHLEDRGHNLENIIYLELRRRFSNVYVGEMKNGEVDFVAMSATKDIHYFQVALETSNDETLQRELRSLESITDNYPKTLLTLDSVNKNANYNGIIKKNAIDWLLEDETL
jgi:predicted AAA+ superfamily ATPase